MKKLIIFFFAVPFLSLLVTGCKKNDGAVPVTLERVPTMTLKKGFFAPQIDFINLNNFKDTFSVDLLNKEDIKPTKVDIVVIKKRKGKIIAQKLFRADVTTFPTHVIISAKTITDLFDEALKLGDDYDFGADVYTISGKKYQAFPPDILVVKETNGVKDTTLIPTKGDGGGIQNQPGAGSFVRYSVICQYNPDIYQGDFEVLEDEWEDYFPGDVVTITKVSANQFSFMYPANGAKPIIVTVNAISNETSVIKQVYGTGYGSAWKYGSLSAESVPSVENAVAPCERTFSVLLKHNVPEGEFGEFKIKMKKIN